jgi:hypothetical protein
MKKPLGRVGVEAATKTGEGNGAADPPPPLLQRPPRSGWCKVCESTVARQMLVYVFWRVSFYLALHEW